MDTWGLGWSCAERALLQNLSRASFLALAEALFGGGLPSEESE